MNDSLRILVTGAQGTLGLKLVEELIERGHDVYGADMRHSPDPKIVRADVSDFRQIDNLVCETQPHYIYHLAAEFGRHNGEEFYEQLWRNNAIGTQNVIETSIRFGAKLIFASSSEAYGTLADKDGLIHESRTEFQPGIRFHNQYALSKWCNEKQIEIAVANRDLKAQTLRFFNAYGPGEFYNPYRSVVCLFIYRLLHDMPITVYKDYHRVFMYVSDWAHTVANVAEKWHKGYLHNGDVFNIGGEEYCSVEALVEKIKTHLWDRGIRSESVVTVLEKEKANITNKRPDNQHAKAVLGHNPIITLDDGIPMTIDWMLDTYGEDE